MLFRSAPLGSSEQRRRWRRTATGGDTRRESNAEGEGEGEGVPEDAGLTRSPKGRPERGEELGNGGNGARRAAAGVEEGELDSRDWRPPSTHGLRRR